MSEFLGEAHAMKAYLETRLRDAEERAEKAERERDGAREEIARLRDIISPGDAAAYEQGMAALQAKLARVVEAGGHLRGFAAGSDLGQAYVESWDAITKDKP